MHPLDSSLDASVHDHRLGAGHCRPSPSYLGNHHNRVRRPRRTSLDNGVATTEELILLVTSSNKSVASMARSNSIDTLDNSTDNVLFSTGQWYNYSSDDDMMEESDYFATSGYIKPKRQSSRGQRRLSLNNCTAMNMTFLANYNVSTADKSDLDLDCHNYFDENKTTGGGSSSADTMSVGTRSSYQSNNDSVSAKLPNANAVSDDDHGVNETFDDDDDDDDDMDSFGEAEDAEPADEEYIRQNLGASFWSDDVEGLPPPPPVRRGGKKTTSRKMAPGGGIDDEENMGLTNTSNNSNPIPNDSGRTTSSCEFTVMNTHPIVVYDTMNDPFHQDDNDDGCDTMDIYHDETLDATVDDAPRATSLYGTDAHQSDHHGDAVRDNAGDNDDDDAQEDDEYEYNNNDDDSDCDSFCDANDDEKADKEYMKRVLGASVVWNNSMEDLSYAVDVPAPPKRSLSKRSASGRHDHGTK